MNKDRSSHAVGDKGRQESWLKKFMQSLFSKPLLRKPADREQLGGLLRSAEKHNLLDADALAMIEGVLNVSDMQVREVMVPRSQMIVIKENESPDVFLPVMVDSAHSRFPVIGDNRDEVEGIILAKDVLAYFGERDLHGEKKSGARFNLRDLLRPAVIVPESKRLNVLLKDFRANRNHMAIVVDEYGGVSGLVTIEDVLEQIVGDIVDEHDFEDDVFIVRHSDTKFTLKALTPIDDFNEYFETAFSDDEFDTIGGLLMNKFGRLPKRGESAELDRFRFTVLRADSRRIHLLQLSILPESSSEPSPGED